ncbi:hypothetical protein [Petroclostridium sp. X23]|uniref:hypothetical protein n=1 Tax=Petroclostridium sp. X23 TaxID=3045146 RepID=UPI0024AD172C|nr:hypothetical protein [Petroclostridium sp. X23]WHH59166.1 hypothetical protein QKW49_25830 [Petroclostridium sp. X23]
MFNAKEAIKSAFTNDATLVAMLGKIKTARKQDIPLPSIFTSYPKAWDGLPAISYYELDNADSEFADDECIGEEIVVMIDIWSEGSTTAIFRRVDYLMKQMGFVREAAPDVPDPNVNHKAVRYKIIKEVEE